MALSDLTVLTDYAKNCDSLGATNKKLEFWLVHTTAAGGGVPQMLVKNYHFLLLPPFEPDAFKTCEKQNFQKRLEAVVGGRVNPNFYKRQPQITFLLKSVKLFDKYSYSSTSAPTDVRMGGQSNL